MFSISIRSTFLINQPTPLLSLLFFPNLCCVILYVCVILTVSIVCGVPSCISGYMGERCQFSDLEWWELQQAEQEKRRNVAIALGMVVLITLLSIAACVTYCYG